MNYLFKAVLTEKGWQENVRITVDGSGTITKICPDAAGGDAEYIHGYALPGFQNAHSHAFQYAMCGLAECFSPGNTPGNFWSWRDAMYRVALAISPEQMENIAAMLYAEMLKNGYTSVAEFHYVHHDVSGKPYGNLSEMGERLVAAAERAGIRITLLPVFYCKGGFGKAANIMQRRFISASYQDYLQLLDASSVSVKYYRNASIGAAAHSLRAVEERDLIAASLLSAVYPFHLHISEQQQEIEDCIAYYGQRPVEWLYNHVEVNENFHLIHATHLNDDEVKAVASSKAHVVLCPSTEGNLGDGRFRLKDFRNRKGRWSIGSDSQIGLGYLEELRILDYAQRIHSHRRDTFVTETSGNSGFNALEESWFGGKKAMGTAIADTFFEVGAPLDAVVFDANWLLLATASEKNRCNTIVYSAQQRHILGTMTDGKWVVKDGIHFSEEEINRLFVRSLHEINMR